MRPGCSIIRASLPFANIGVLRAVSAQNADICERANTRAARGRRAQRRYLRGQRNHERTGGKRQPCGLPGAAQSDPQVRRREVSALWAVAAKGGKATRRREQIQGLRAVSAQNADICERANTRAARGRRAQRRYLRGQRNHERAEGKRRPRGLPGEAQSDPQVRRREVSALWAVAAKGGKATRRREQIQGLRAVSAQNADICERANPRAARGRRAQRRYLRGQRNHERDRPESANDGATDDPPAPRALSTSCARPALPGGQTVEKPLILGRAAFLAPFRRSQRLQEMLRHKALGLCPKPRQGPEAPAPRTLSAAHARPALPGGAFLCPFHSPRNVIHYTQPFSPA